MPRKNSKAVLAWGFVAIAAAGIIGIIGYRSMAGASQLPIRTVAVTVGSIEKTISALGSVKPRDYVDVGAQVSGQLRTVHVEIGDRVEVGQLLAEIDSTVYRARVAADRAKLADLKAQLDQQKATSRLSSLQFERIQRLFKANAISRDSLDSAQTAAEIDAAKIASIQAQINQAQSTLEGDEASLSYTRIHAPMSGIVVAQTTLAGQTINANQSAPTILRIADLDTMTVWANVAEADIGRLSPGMEAYFATLGDPDRRWNGVVRQILPTPTIVNDVVLFNVLIDVANQGMKLMSEMTAQVFFVQGHAENVPIVPLGALKPTSKAGIWQASVRTASGAESRTVATGLATRTEAQVLSGLSVGEHVIIGTAASQAKAKSGGTAPMGMGGGPRL